MLEMLSLIALGFGYMVLTVAAKEKKNTRFLGQAIGALIMTASVLSILCYSFIAAYQKGCPFSGKKSHCPMITCPMGGK